MERPAFEIATSRLWVQVPSATAARRVLEYCLRNRGHLEPWEPPRPTEYFTVPFWRRQLALSRDEFENGQSVRTVLVERDRLAADGGRSGPVIGVVNISQILRGAFQACVIGYSLDATCQGRGLMCEAIAAVLRYTFEELDLNRVMANYRPENRKSANVLERLGFEREGFAKEYLYIDGEWRDHVLTSLTRSAWVRSLDDELSPLGARASGPRGGPETVDTARPGTTAAGPVR